MIYLDIFRALDEYRVDLITLKQNTGRPQDQSDIEHLERLRG